MACLSLTPKLLASVLAGKAFASVHAGLCFLEHRVVVAARLSSAIELPADWLGWTCIDEELVRGAVMNIPVYVHTERDGN
jgi:hypothetical protein